MSYSFSVRGPRVGEVGLRALLDSLPPDDVASDPPPGPGAGAAPLPALVRLFRPTLSTRAIEVSRSGAELRVRVLVCSSCEDHELALAIAAGAAELIGVREVEPEDHAPVLVEELSARFNRSWFDDELGFGAATAARLVEEHPGQVVSMDGPVRRFLMGARLLGELRSDGPGAYPGRLIAAMRRTQWPGEARAATVFEVRDPARSVRIAVLSGGSRTILPDVDGIAVRSGDEQFYVRPDTVVELLAGLASFLDERQILVEPVEPDRWAVFRANAIAAGIALGALKASPERRVSAT